MQNPKKGEEIRILTFKSRPRLEPTIGGQWVALHPDTDGAELALGSSMDYPVEFLQNWSSEFWVENKAKI